MPFVPYVQSVHVLGGHLGPIECLLVCVVVVLLPKSFQYLITVSSSLCLSWFVAVCMLEGFMVEDEQL